MSNIKLLYIDLFCGAGGTSSGVEYARHHGHKCAKVIACVNHDKNAILSHAANHPGALHFTEDIRTLKLSPMIEHLQKMKVRYPDAHVVLWASLECTNFSKAKGGQPRDADSRTLAEHLFRYIEAIRPSYIEIENVEEFMCWGDLDGEGKPISKYEGRSYIKWVKDVMRYGYTFEHKILNAADFGAYTSRRRFFGLFAKKGLTIAFPIQTYAKETDMFGHYKKWKPVKEVLDLNDEGDSIFGRKKPLCEATLNRIYAGLIKFVAGGEKAFLVKWNSMKNGNYRAPSINEPSPTLPCRNTLAIAKVQFLSKQYGGNPSGKNISIEQPAGTLTCIDHHAFMSVHYGNGFIKRLDVPAPTIMTHDNISLITSKFLMNPQYTNKGGSIDKPCFTLIARMDKMPPYLISTEEGFGIQIYDTDSPMTVKIKEFMALYSIIDIKMRMLNVAELKRIMGFPDSYTLIGTQAEQKKLIGNAVEVNMSRALCEALCNKLSTVSLRAS